MSESLPTPQSQSTCADCEPDQAPGLAARVVTLVFHVLQVNLFERRGGNNRITVFP